MFAYTHADVLRIYVGSDGVATKVLYEHLRELGPIGEVAINLFRAQKASERAKVYRGGGYREAAYDKKDWSVDNLCNHLTDHASALALIWGWSRDEATIGFEHVLYIDLPTGQVSFHAPRRHSGPDYPGEWDGKRGQSPARIVKWVAQVLA